MSDVATREGAPPIWGSDAMVRRVRHRYAVDRRFRFYGLLAIFIAIALLGILLASLIATGYQALRQTHVTVTVFIDPELIDESDLFKSDWRNILRESFAAVFPEVEGPKLKRELLAIPSPGAPYIVRDKVLADFSLIGQTVVMSLPVSDPFDQLNKGNVDRQSEESARKVSDRQIAWFDALVRKGLVSLPFNWALFVNADSRFPEIAGLKGALIGSALALLVCWLLSFPIGVSAAVYLEEFAPKNRWTDIIEVNINNLAAVPSIVFGLLGLAVFLNTFGLPRSSPLVGGMCLALMTLPTIIIAGRAALKSVPPSIREAALGIGASHQQTILHHVLPLAMPGILTGTIIGLAQALGETAPLLLIGMNAFLTEAPSGITSPATALPTQIYIWADSPERGFLSRTAAGILVLLGFLILMNAAAIYLRRRFERRW